MSPVPLRPVRRDLKAAARSCHLCGTRLSAYNVNPTCWAHTPEQPWKGPNQKPK